MVVKIKVRHYTGEERIIGLCDTEEQFKRITVLQLKEKIVSAFGLESGSEDVQLFFDKQCLEEGALLSDYRIKHMSAIHTVSKLTARGYPARRDGGIGDKEGRNQSTGDSAVVGRGPPDYFCLGHHVERATRAVAQATDTTKTSRLTHRKLFVKTLNGKTWTITFTEKEFKSATVLQMKRKIRETEGITEDQQRLIFADRQLEDQKLLSDYGLVHEATIHIRHKLRGGGDEGTRGRGDGGMGDREGRNLSMDKLAGFSKCTVC